MPIRTRTINGVRLGLAEDYILSNLCDWAVKHVGEWFTAREVFAVGHAVGKGSCVYRASLLARRGIPQAVELECWETPDRVWFSLSPRTTLAEHLAAIADREAQKPISRIETP